MAHLNKNQYEARREAASNRNDKNSELAKQNGMTEDQASLITELCSLRHEFHSSLDAIAKSCEDDTKNRLVLLNVRISDSGLNSMDFIPDDFIDIDNMDELMNPDLCDDQPDEDEDPEGWQNWYDTEYERIYDELEALNKKIEEYLSEIDGKYGTEFAPTGALRNF